MAGRQDAEAAEKARREHELQTALQLAETEKARAAAEAQRAEEQGRHARRLRQRALWLAGALAVAAVLAALALFFGQAAKNSAQEAGRNLDAAQTAQVQALAEADVRATAEAVALTEADARATQQAVAEREFYTRATAEAIAVDERQAALASAGYDNTARLWDVATGQELRRFAGHSDVIFGLAYAPDGKTIATASWDKTFRLWHVDINDTIAYLCSQLQRDLTPEERAQYGVGEGATCPLE